MEKFPRDRLSFKEKIGDGQFGEVYIALADISGWSAPFGEDYAGKTKITVAVKTLKCRNKIYFVCFFEIVEIFDHVVFCYR